MHFKLLPPWFISGGLNPAFKVGDGGSVELWSPDGGGYWDFAIRDGSGAVIYDTSNVPGSGITSPPVTFESDFEALEHAAGALMSFLQHEAESALSGEPSDGWLFNSEVADWAYQNDDSLSELDMIFNHLEYGLDREGNELNDA